MKKKIGALVVGLALGFGILWGGGYIQHAIFLYRFDRCQSISQKYLSKGEEPWQNPWYWNSVESCMLGVNHE